MKRILLLLLLIISINSFSQNTIATKDIADIVLPNPEVELFYGHVNFSANGIVILPKHIIVYSAENATFHLLDKKTKLTLDQKSLFDLKNIVTHRQNFGEYINGKYRKLKSYRTPFVDLVAFNEITMYSLSDTSAYGGIIRIKKDYKIVKLFVKNDSLKLHLIDFNIKKSFRKVTKSEKRKKIQFDRYRAVPFRDFIEFKDKQIFSYGSSPYINKKSINYKDNGRKYFRDSIINFNSVYYRVNGQDSLRLLYQNPYSDVSKLYKQRPKNGFWFYPQLYKSKNRLILRLEGEVDSIIIFDENLHRVFKSNLQKEIDKTFPNKITKKRNWWTRLLKDEFTKKIYVQFESKKGFGISEVAFIEKTGKIEFRFLRELSYSGSYIYPITINKGILYLGTKNKIIGNKYVYAYDLYKNIDNKDSVLEIKFKNVKNQITKTENKNAWLLSNENYQPLSKKLQKKYFKEIKRDTSVFNQSSYLNVLKSIKKSITQDSIRYVLSYLLAYNSLDRLEIKDDIKSKNYLYFVLLTEFYNKDEALSQINYFINDFDSFDRQMYKNKMIVRTPDGFVFEIYQFNDLWFLSSVTKRITYETDE